MEEQAYAGVCGLYCGLCPKFQSQAPSRCQGCHPGAQHDYCSTYRCCVKKHGHYTCAECADYPCERLLRLLGVEQALDSFISHKPALANLERLRQVGLDSYLAEQRERRLLLETLLAHYNAGRSMTFYCAACALVPPALLAQTLTEGAAEIVARGVAAADIKARAKIMREVIELRAAEAGIDLKLRRQK